MADAKNRHFHVHNLRSSLDTVRGGRGAEPPVQSRTVAPVGNMSRSVTMISSSPQRSRAGRTPVAYSQRSRTLSRVVDTPVLNGTLNRPPGVRHSTDILTHKLVSDGVDIRCTARRPQAQGRHRSVQPNRALLDRMPCRVPRTN